MVRAPMCLVALCAVSLASPVAAQSAKLVAQDGSAFDQFGWSVTADGRHVVVGAHFADGQDFNTGKAYVWRSTGTDWVLESEIASPAPYINDRFGIGLHLDGDLLLVAADSSDGGTSESEGAVHVFRRSGTSWHEEQLLSPDSLKPLARFGTAIDSQDGRIVVGAPTLTNDLDQDGSVYVFTRSGGVWVEEAVVRPHDIQEEHLFGRAVQVQERLLAVGAIGDNEVTVQAGAVYLFEDQGGGQWVETQKLISPDIDKWDAFGQTLALEGPWLAVGAPNDDDDGITAGSVYMYRRAGSGWTLFQKLVAPDGQKNGWFGRSLSLDGGRLAVGALNADAGFAGAAYVFAFNGVEWRFASKHLPLATGLGGEFGIDVDLAGGRLVCGAYLDGEVDDAAGAAYVIDVDGSAAPADVGAADLVTWLMGLLR